jgi:mono/diheme cytochrome c family protein
MNERRWAFVGRALAMSIAVLAIASAVWMSSRMKRGFSARQEPSALEARLARTIRHVAVPELVRLRKNPIQATDEALSAGRAHWADHCASCHGNDGSGDTEVGRGLYPRAPDMRESETQNLSDGELFGIIRDGIPLSGMPAWGSGRAQDETENWHLVLFIRHLPKITPEEIAAMERLNPKTPAEMQQMHDEDEFLNGGSAPATSHHSHQENP